MLSHGNAQQEDFSRSLKAFTMVALARFSTRENLWREHAREPGREARMTRSN
jgi:hypothetical protein